MRCLRPALALLAAPLLFVLCLNADDKPTLTGNWELDAASSQALDGKTMTLTIDNSSSTVKMTQVVHERDGKEATYQFTCAAGGGECEFDDAGHKAKVTLWYSGPSLVVLTTDGPKEDSSNEWTLKLSPDSKTLTLLLEHIEPEAKSETLVFNKK
jgi:hypothetical protein